jgi:hypothetical protein
MSVVREMSAVHASGCNICQAHICEHVVSECEQLCVWLAGAQRERDRYEAALREIEKNHALGIYAATVAAAALAGGGE